MGKLLGIVLEAFYKSIRGIGMNSIEQHGSLFYSTLVC